MVSLGRELKHQLLHIMRNVLVHTQSITLQHEVRGVERIIAQPVPDDLAQRWQQMVLIFMLFPIVVSLNMQ